jgi:hypothetical protein
MADIQKGALTEALAAARFLELGYTVLAPVLDQRPPYDLVVEKGGRFLRVQVKTGHRMHGDGSNTLAAGRIGSRSRSYGPEDVDFILIYDPTDGEFYMIPSAAIPPGQKRITVNLGARVQSNTRFRGEDYRLC